MRRPVSVSERASRNLANRKAIYLSPDLDVPLQSRLQACCALPRRMTPEAQQIELSAA